MSEENNIGGGFCTKIVKSRKRDTDSIVFSGTKFDHLDEAVGVARLGCVNDFVSIRVE